MLDLGADWWQRNRQNAYNFDIKTLFKKKINNQTKINTRASINLNISL